MKNGNRFRFAFYSFAQRKSTFFLASLLMAVSLVLCGMSKMYYEIVEYNESSTDKVLKNGISKTGVLDIDLDWDNNTADAYRMKLIETGLFEAIGSMELCTLFAENLEELLEIQNKGEVINEELNTEEEVEMLLLDCTLFELCDLELFAGEKMNEDASKKVNDTYSKIYLGYNFKDIPVGTVYMQKTGEITYTYEVAGILKKGQKFVGNELMYSVDMEEFDSSINLDNEILCAYHSGTTSGRWFFSIKDSVKIEDAMEKIYEVAKKYDGYVSASSLNVFFREAKADMEAMVFYLTQIMTIITIVSIVVVVTQQITAVYNNMKEYGILYAMGSSEKDMFYILLFENIIKSFIAMVIAFLFVVILGNYCFSIQSEVRGIYYQILVGKMLPFMVLMIIAYTFLSSIVSIFFFRKFSPVQLMKGNK